MVLANEMARVQDPISALMTATQTCMNNLITAAPAIKGLGGKDSSLSILLALDEVSDEFTDAMVSKVPLTTKGFGRSGGQKVKDMIAEAIKVFRK
jgi:hypothetical protein